MKQNRSEFWIISNDENFYAADIGVMTSRAFCEKVGVLDI